MVYRELGVLALCLGPGEQGVLADHLSTTKEPTRLVRKSSTPSSWRLGSWGDGRLRRLVHHHEGVPLPPPRIQIGTSSPTRQGRDGSWQLLPGATWPVHRRDRSEPVEVGEVPHFVLHEVPFTEFERLDLVIE